MIGNNSCGATAQRTGKVVDNIAAPGGAAVRRHPVLVRADQRRGVRARSSAAATGRPGSTGGCGELRDTYGDQIRATYPDIPRRVSGYNLDSLLPEHGFDVAGLLVGSESTLVTVLRAELEAGARA